MGTDGVPDPVSEPAARVAIVTGGAQGIGRATAVRLAADGCDIAVVDLDAERCAETVAAVRAEGRRALAVGADVSDEPSVIAAVARVATELGPPAVLVNNAGVLREGLAAKMELADFQLLLDVNLTGTFLISREVQPYMRAQKWGRIVNLSSIGALGLVGLTGYGATKAGVQAMTKTMAIELGRHGVTVNAVAPGFIVTDMNRDLADRQGMTFEELEQQMVRDVPVGRSGTAEDIANAIAFFVDERSGFVSGQVLYVAGGPQG